jgi:hypothetical protein
MMIDCQRHYIIRILKEKISGHCQNTFLLRADPEAKEARENESGFPKIKIEMLAILVVLCPSQLVV